MIDGVDVEPRNGSVGESISRGSLTPDGAVPNCARDRMRRRLLGDGIRLLLRDRMRCGSWAENGMDGPDGTAEEINSGGIKTVGVRRCQFQKQGLGLLVITSVSPVARGTDRGVATQ